MLQKIFTIAVVSTLCLGAIATLPVSAAPYQYSARQPRFVDYLTRSIFKGKPHRLIIDSPTVKDYADELPEIVKKGTNFAGHYAIAYVDRAMGGEGTAAIVDLKTGKIYTPAPLYAYRDQSGAGENPPRPDGGLHFRADSNLLIITGEAGGHEGSLGIGHYYYKWENNQLVFLKFVDAP